MASYMGEGEDLFCQENKRLIQSIVKEQDLNLIGIMKADGHTYYNNGARKNVKNRGYFKKVMQGQKIMSPPLESKVDGRTKVILAVPIYRNGKVTGALGASYNVGALNQMLFNDIYDGIGFSMIIDTSGKIISFDSGLSY
jgi:sulfatase maturation enzyme AslB (radical SAM superfamily)